MNTKLISQLSAASAITGAEKLELEQSSNSVYSSVANIFDSYGISSQTAIGSAQAAIVALASSVSAITAIQSSYVTSGSGYHKYADGAMDQWGHFATTAAITVTASNLFRSAAIKCEFTTAFSSAVYTVNANTASATAGALFVGAISARTVTSFSAYIISASNDSYVIDILWRVVGT